MFTPVLLQHGAHSQPGLATPYDDDVVTLSHTRLREAANRAKRTSQSRAWNASTSGHRATANNRAGGIAGVSFGQAGSLLLATFETRRGISYPSLAGPRKTRKFADMSEHIERRPRQRKCCEIRLICRLLREEVFTFALLRGFLGVFGALATG